MIAQSPSWQNLSKHQQELAASTLTDLFSKDPQRFTNFSFKLDDLLMDFSKQLITQETINLLCALAHERNLSTAIQNLFSGAIVNLTENRPALHTELRNPNSLRPEIKQCLDHMQRFVQEIQRSKYSDVIVLGIGGSDLGPRLVCEALAPYKTSKLCLHFVSNVDEDEMALLLPQLDPTQTICLINSKTFTTIETLANAKLIKAWLGANAAAQMWAVTANPGAAEQFGIYADHIFMFWDWVGGRYSVWSAVGLAIALSVGMDHFKAFLSGAHAMDQHFYNTPFTQNIPVLLALIGVWQINFLHYPTLCVQPYAAGLQLLPAYLQQLEMESNGKHAAIATAPVIWGGVGCNSQHAFMQMLHQGTQIVPVDFLVARRSISGSAQLQQLLVASCIGQSQALMTGCNSDQPYKVCPGNRPSTTIIFDSLTPQTIGKLIALYEHKVFVQGIIWQIQSFDQWGVQLGKELIKDALQLMQADNTTTVDSSTAGLIQYYLKGNP